MSSIHALPQLLDHSARSRPAHPAVEEQEHVISYRELAYLSDKLRDRLVRLGVGPGDRVGIDLHKSIDAVAAILGIMKAGAAYVPVDPRAPASRNAYIFNNCSVRVAIVEQQFLTALRPELEKLGKVPPLLATNGVGGGKGLESALSADNDKPPAAAPPALAPHPDALAYILYTSGSTGRPKGVMLSHRNALSFVDWCSETFAPHEKDRFSSHAPFHFDLSILDIYVPIKHGATLVLVGEDDGKDPAGLASLIAEKRITVWYSTPSILSLLTQYGNLPRYDYSPLRTILFAGEVFPVKYLRALQRLLPNRRYFNLYGPTETNVCTYFEIPGDIPEERNEPYPIGKNCSHLNAKVVDECGQELPHGAEGELCIHGPGVMQGYWNLPEQTVRAFWVDAAGRPWYKTGDLVSEDSEGNYVFLGRRDRMVKKRGYRVELGEIESCLYHHPAVKEAAVIALADDEAGLRLKAFLSTREGNRLSLIALKQFCSDHLPPYMIPDLFSFQPTLPKTSTDKVDYQRLKELV